MTDLNLQARELINAAKDADEPTLADRERVLKAIKIAATQPMDGSAAKPGANSTALPRHGRLSRRYLLMGVAAISIIAISLTYLAKHRTLSPEPIVLNNKIDKPSADSIRLAAPTSAPGSTPTLPNFEKRDREPRHKKQLRPLVIPSSTLEAELKLLRAAQLARQNKQFVEAQQFLQEHQKQFSAGLLTAEREATRILVLCDQHQLKQARQAAKQFLRAYPRSPLVRTIRDSCAFSKSN